MDRIGLHLTGHSWVGLVGFTGGSSVSTTSILPPAFWYAVIHFLRKAASAGEFVRGRPPVCSLTAALAAATASELSGLTARIYFTGRLQAAQTARTDPEG